MMWGSSNPIRRWPAGGLLVAAVWLVMSFAEVAHGAPLSSVAGSDPWTERAELVPADGAASDYLGRSVAIDGDTAVVGAAAADVGDNMDQGAAYVFVRSGDTWTQTAKLTSSDGAAGDEFGFAVAISGDTIVIGSRFSAIGGVNGAGAAYVFVRSGTDWLPQGKLTADDGTAFDELGFSVATDGDTAVVGAPFANSSRGKVYVFTRSGTDWTGQAMLAADDAADFDRFGLALAVKADTLLIGSPSADIGANTDQGAVYVFDRSGVAWTSSAKLAADDGGAFDEFGNAVALDGDTAVVGAHYANVGNNQNQGAAYAFVRGGGLWNQQAKLVGDHSSFTDEFGFSVALSGDTAVAGALFANPNGQENQGEAYVFVRQGSDWAQQAWLVSDGGMGDEFGIGVAVDGDTAVIGAESAAVDGEWRGAAYVYSSRTTGGTCANPIVENFDGVTTPSLPAGWTFTAAQGTGPWATVSDFADSAPNAAFVPDESSPSDLYLDTPAFVPQAGSTLSFRHRYDFEETYDGGVLEISIAGAPFTDIIAAGGSFVAGGYPETMQGSSAIAGRDAWTGDTAGAFITTTVNYPAAAIGQSVQLRWRAASDVTVGHAGWWVDTITLGCNDGAEPVARADVSPASLKFALAPGTSASNPVTIANVGDAGSSLAFSIDESDGADCTVPADVPWLSIDPAVGNVAAGESEDVSVTADATGLAVGDYSALVCVGTSDATRPLIAVDVSLTVSGQDPDVIFADGFDGP